jgi:hypothetical protein
MLSALLCCKFNIMKTLVNQPETLSSKKAILQHEHHLGLNEKQTNQTKTTYIKSTAPLFAKRKGNPKLYIL